MPKRNWTETLAPGCTGAGRAALIVELKPPPFGWLGGCSSVVPSTSTFAPFTLTDVGLEVLGRRSETPNGDGKVVSSLTRNRSRVIGAVVELVIVRRMVTDPKVSF